MFFESFLGSPRSRLSPPVADFDSTLTPGTPPRFAMRTSRIAAAIGASPAWLLLLANGRIATTGTRSSGCGARVARHHRPSGTIQPAMTSRTISDVRRQVLRPAASSDVETAPVTLVARFRETRRRSSRRSCADGYRSSRSRAIARATTRLTSAGTDGFTWCASVGVFVIIATASSSGSTPANGRRPVRSSYSRMPRP